jgi:hypothetical protein
MNQEKITEDGRKLSKSNATVPLLAMPLSHAISAGKSMLVCDSLAQKKNLISTLTK